MGFLSEALVATATLTAQASSANAYQSDRPASSQVGVLITGPGFMATFGNLPSDRLTRAETTGSTADVSFAETGMDSESAVDLRVVRLGSQSASYLRSIEAVREQMFRDDMAKACVGPVRVVRTLQPANVASNGARPVRLVAECATSKDRRWSKVQFVSESLTNGAVRCLWSIRQSRRVSAVPLKPPVQDVCLAVGDPSTGGSTAISIIR